MRIYPFNSEVHAEGIVSTVTESIAPDSVSVDKFVTMRKEQTKLFEGDWSESVHESFSKK